MKKYIEAVVCQSPFTKISHGRVYRAAGPQVEVQNGLRFRQDHCRGQLTGVEFLVKGRDLVGVNVFTSRGDCLPVPVQPEDRQRWRAFYTQVPECKRFVSQAEG